jgi:hypothetical protein
MSALGRKWTRGEVIVSRYVRYRTVLPSAKVHVDMP